jgi:spore coat protein U-like protein
MYTISNHKIILRNLLLILLLCNASSFAACRVYPGDVNFGLIPGSYPGPGPSVTSTVSIICDEPGTHTNVCIGIPPGNGGTYTRYMARPGTPIRRVGYILYAPDGVTPWGDDAGPGGTLRYCPGTISGCTDITSCRYNIIAKYTPTYFDTNQRTYSDSLTAKLYYDSTTYTPSTTTFMVSGYHNTGCTVWGEVVQFSDYDPQSPTNITYTGTPIHVKCTSGTSYTVGLQYTGQLSAPSKISLNYSVLDPTCSSAWGVIGSGYNASGTGTGNQQNIGVCAIIPSSQTTAQRGERSEVVTIQLRY